MHGAGIRELGGSIEVLDLPEPRELRPDEILIAVRAAGAGNWDEIARTGGWDLGIEPPLALGVEAAGTVVACGSDVAGFAIGDELMTHPLPLRDQGTWADRLIAPAHLVAVKPPSIPWAVAGAFPVPALTAHQVLAALGVEDGTPLLVHGAGGITGGLIVQLAALAGAQVVATAGPRSSARVREMGASEVLDYADPGWPAEVRRLTEGHGVRAAANAARNGAAAAVLAVADGGRLVTITSDAPAEERGIQVSSVYVRPDGRDLAQLAQLLGKGRLTVSVGRQYPLADAAQALTAAVNGGAGGAIVICPP